MRIQGVLATDKPPYRRDVGIVFQSYALFPHMTVAGDGGYSPRDRMRKVPASNGRLRVRPALDLVHVGAGLEGRCSGRLLGGQQQRVAVAQAIVIRPSGRLY